MRVVVAYCPKRLEPRTRAWGETHGAEFRDTSADGEAWYRLVAELWSDGEAFMLVDHDVVPPVGAVEGFAACAEDLCVYPFLTDNPQASPAAEEIGCTRFARELIQRFPALVEDAVSRWDLSADMPYDETNRHHHWLAVMLRWEFKARGVRYHAHEPAAEHIRDPNALVAKELRRSMKLIATWRRRAAASDVNVDAV